MKPKEENSELKLTYKILKNINKRAEKNKQDEASKATQEIAISTLEGKKDESSSDSELSIDLTSNTTEAVPITYNDQGSSISGGGFLASKLTREYIEKHFKEKSDLLKSKGKKIIASKKLRDLTNIKRIIFSERIGKKNKEILSKFFSEEEIKYIVDRNFENKKNDKSGCHISTKDNRKSTKNKNK